MPGPKELDTFAAAMTAANGKLAQARMINLMDDMRMGSGDQQPLEGLLGRAVPEIGHPK